MLKKSKTGEILGNLVIKNPTVMVDLRHRMSHSGLICPVVWVFFFFSPPPPIFCFLSEVGLNSYTKLIVTPISLLREEAATFAQQKKINCHSK